MGSGIPTLGTLQPVPLREAWANEATGFTPWLHDEANMMALGEVLGLDQLVAVGREQAVGPFSADLLAEDSFGHRVLIENQLEQSDHDHLGKCLTYAAGLKAKVVVWLCSKIREEHRAAVDWLNEISTEDYSFFAVEIELYRIGDSIPAPRFNVAANPNKWSRGIQRQARRAESEMTDAQRAHYEYWSQLIESAAGRYGALSRRKAFKGNWQTAESLSVKDLSIDLYATKSKSGLRCEIYFYSAAAKLGFDYARDLIVEEDLLSEFPLSFERMDDKATSRIATYFDPGVSGIATKESEHDWIIDTLQCFAEVAHLMAKNLRLDPTPIELDLGEAS